MTTTLCDKEKCQKCDPIDEHYERCGDIGIDITAVGRFGVLTIYEAQECERFHGCGP